ncbi:hypothetical protein AB0K09_09175 [Streptomyces sp. NPDC049577]|uniref:hypothetical protein n=1 Tax=Streptomyces sp. NPDC049577 TaxID=3155153 RepID=UPI00341DD24A
MVRVDMGRHLTAAHDYYVADRRVVGGYETVQTVGAEERRPVGDPPVPAVFEGYSVPIRTAASLLGLSPWTVAHLIERGELCSERGGQYRYVTLTSIFSYRRRTR